MKIRVEKMEKQPVMIIKNPDYSFQKLTEIRDYKIVKHNDLIQKSRFHLSLLEQKIILYLISKIKPGDIEIKEHVFRIQDFFKVCGLVNSGENYKIIKSALLSLRNRGMWVTMTDGVEVTMSWLDKVMMYRNSGTVMIKIDDMLKPYLLQLKENFTQYELLYTLAMQSQYSLRLYEILKSYEFRKRISYDVEALKRTLSAEKYTLFGDFKRRVLDIALREINDLSDITVSYALIKKNRKYVGVDFIIALKKDLDERMATWKRIYDKVEPPVTP